NYAVTYRYEEHGRMVSRTMNGIPTPRVYDQRGRTTTIGDPIGSFAYAYSGNSGRIATVTYPNGQTSSYAYLPVNQDLRLQEIHHRKPDASTLNRFTYSYDTVGNILTSTQQTDSNAPYAYDFEYDRAGQLRAATYRTTSVPPTVLKRYRWAYDPSGNRTAEQIDDLVTAFTYDSMNRLSRQQPGGALSFEGTLSEPATVAVGGHGATLSSPNVFSGTAVVSSGTGQVGVQATDASGNVRTNTYDVTQAGATKALAYDANGNTILDGARIFEWDAANRLLAVREGANTLATFTYDGGGRRARKSAGVVTTTFVYDQAQFAEERTSVGSTTRYVYGPGLDRPLVEVAGSITYRITDNTGHHG